MERPGDDRDLVARVRRGDRAAFRTLFDGNFPRLYRFALARLDGDHDAATEVVQETFCKAIPRLDDFRGEAALYTWLYRICSNTLIDFCRRNRRAAERLVRLDDSQQARQVLATLAAPAGSQPESVFGRVQVRGLVQAVLDRMPDGHAAALEMKYLESLSVREIGDRLGIGPKAAESLLTRSRESFRRVFADLAGSPDASRSTVFEDVTP